MSLSEEPGEPTGRDPENIFADARIEFVTVLRWLLSVLIQAVFLGLWVIIQWAVNEYVVMRFRVTSIDKAVLVNAQYVFGIATLAPIMFFLLKLIVTMAIRTFLDIRVLVKMMMKLLDADKR